MSEELENFLLHSIQTYTGVTITDKNQHLLHPALGIQPSCFIYIFDSIEKQYGILAPQILENNDYRVFTVNNLVKALCKSIKSRA